MHFPLDISENLHDKLKKNPSNARFRKFLDLFRYIPAWNIIFQEMRFPHRSHIARIPISTLLEI